MKDFKTLMIGFLLATCMFLLMGQGSSKSDVGTYQAFADEQSNWMIDTRTGVLYEQSIYTKKWKRISPLYDIFRKD